MGVAPTLYDSRSLDGGGRNDQTAEKFGRRMRTEAGIQANAARMASKLLGTALAGDSLPSISSET